MFCVMKQCKYEFNWIIIQTYVSKTEKEEKPYGSCKKTH
jgi:hypothetical protein